MKFLLKAIRERKRELKKLREQEEEERKKELGIEEEKIAAERRREYIEKVKQTRYYETDRIRTFHVNLFIGTFVFLLFKFCLEFSYIY